MTSTSAVSSPLPITVVVCCYNAESTIAETLWTLQDQTCPAQEILVIDDGSQDRSIEIVSQVAAGASHIRLIRNGANRGTAYTRHRGLQEANTEAVMFFDADDLAEPRLLEKQGRMLAENPDILGVGCHAYYVSENAGQQNLGRQCVGPTDRNAALQQFRSNKLTFMPPVTLFWRRDALAVGGYRQRIMPNAENIRYEDFAEDLDLWCRMSDFGSQGRHFLTIAEPLFRYRKPAGSLSTRNVRMMQLKMRWIKDCLLRRRSGEVERSLADFIASRSILDRVNDWRSDKAAGFYKQAGFSYSSRRYVRLGAFLLLTALASPKLIRQKLKTQSVRP
ncbi:glycosyltransferase family 2 protein [Rhizobium sp. CG5]|uniref:glycosyltransferase family 2 protein n=1 Tax=Rhizobium sp. CG5 TaxID=2726076 RepID=UPI0020340594|nr:glycosyltransferase family 2 protein [Rhizobium sp. CG5]MCM2476086.1 glycosyltransferase family 2 protein [Rhizobium sp. CG5]